MANDEQTINAGPCECCGEDPPCCLCEEGACWKVTSGGATDIAMPTLPTWFDLITGAPTGSISLPPESAVGEPYSCIQTGIIRRCGTTVFDGRTVCWDEQLVVAVICTSEGLEVWKNPPPYRPQQNGETCIYIQAEYPSSAGDAFYEGTWAKVGTIGGGCAGEGDWGGTFNIPISFTVYDDDGASVLGTINWDMDLEVGFSGTPGTCISTSSGGNTVYIHDNPNAGVPHCSGDDCEECFATEDNPIIINPPPGPGFRPPRSHCAGDPTPDILTGTITATGDCGCFGTSITFVWVPYSAVDGAYIATLIVCGSFITLKAECFDGFGWFQNAIVDGINTGTSGGSMSPPGIGDDPREFEIIWVFSANDPCTGSIIVKGP